MPSQHVRRCERGVGKTKDANHEEAQGSVHSEEGCQDDTVRSSIYNSAGPVTIIIA